ncbi:MAG: hypothetical protein OXF06_09770 [Bacteroidetes bacterium]|nr:hypothetical protein [Bacteroidota bacterium]
MTFRQAILPTITILFLVFLGGSIKAYAQVDTTSVAELERRIEILAEELELLRSGEAIQELTADESRALGLAPSAAATYTRRSGPSFAGYGEMLYENYSGDKTTQLDYLRAIFYAGYRFNDRFLFNSEIEVEHANEIFVEFAYIDWLATKNLGVRAGMLLIPVGLVNELHEPTVFIGSERPVTERVIIPSTWRENGAGIYGFSGDLAYRLYVVNGFKGSGFSASGLRGGRQKGVKAKASSLAITGRVDYSPTPGMFVGASFYRGRTDQNEITEGGSDVKATVTIAEAHGQMQYRGIDLRGLYAIATVGEAGRLSRTLGLEGDSGIGERLVGGYLQAGYNLLSQTLSDIAVTPFIRYEMVDTQAEMPEGFTRKMSTKNNYFTAGIEVKPIPQVVLKIDHTWVSNDADTGVNQFNINVGYAF